MNLIRFKIFYFEKFKQAVEDEKFEQFHVINDLRNIFKSVNEYVNIILYNIFETPYMILLTKP